MNMDKQIVEGIEFHKFGFYFFFFFKKNFNSLSYEDITF